ncbi:MAG: AmmeMemoRadiSam system protein B [Aquificaceae bacterium]
MMVKKPNVAGVFYPSEAQRLRSMVNSLIMCSPLYALKPVGFVAPHAGYMYSGSVAGVVYRQLENLDLSRRLRVLLIGPSHHFTFKGVSFGSYTHFETPLGVVEVDRESVERFIVSKSHVVTSISNVAFMKEHSLEVHVPFLQVMLKDFLLVPVLYGDVSAYHIKEVIEFFLSHDDTIFLISSDLSHYHPYPIAKKIDTLCHKGIENLDENTLKKCEACGIAGITGTVLYAKEQGLKGRLLAYKTSADAFGEKGSVVGYGGYVFTS